MKETVSGCFFLNTVYCTAIVLHIQDFILLQ